MRESAGLAGAIGVVAGGDELDPMLGALLTAAASALDAQVAALYLSDPDRTGIQLAVTLGLDDATRTTIHTTIAGAQAEQSKIRGQLRDAYSGLRTLMRQEIPDTAAVSTQLDTIGVLQTEYKKQTTLAWLTTLAQLAPDQRATLREAVRSHGGGRSDRGQ